MIDVKKHFPACENPEGWQDALERGFQLYCITDRIEQAAFIAQAAVESGQFNRLVENLDYSYDRLMRVWPKRFPTLLVAKQYAHQPEKLANYVYAARLGNGDAASGDGWKYRGRGLFQLTGRANYAACGKRTGMPLVDLPSMLEAEVPAVCSAFDFWIQNRLAEVCHDVVATTKRINGGTHGLDQRRQYFEALRK